MKFLLQQLALKLLVTVLRAQTIAASGLDFKLLGFF